MIKKITWVVIGVGIFVAVDWFINDFEYITWDFRNNLWAPAFLLVHSGSPYHIQQLYADGSTAIWFPQLIGIFFPLGFLSLCQASKVWMVINVLALIGMAVFLMRRSRTHTQELIYGVTLIGLVIFPPTLTNIMLGQADFLLVAAMLMAAWQVEKQKLILPALGFAIAISKPQLCFIVIPSLFLSLILKRNWNYGLKLLIYLAAFFIGSTIPLWLADRYWLWAFIRNLQNNPHWLQPSAFSLLQIQYGSNGLLIWIALAIVCVIVSTLIWSRFGPAEAILWSLALTTIAAPYIWSWDFTLLMPLFIDTATRVMKIHSRLTLALTWVICFFFFIWSRQFVSSDHRVWWLPLTMLVGITTSLWMEYSSNRQSMHLRVYTQPVQ